MYMDLDLDGKTAVVTGGSSGIGREICLILAESGVKVVIADIREEPLEEGKPTHQKINKEKGDAIFVKTNVKKEKEIKEMVSKTINQYNNIDILVNNAGIYRKGSIIDEELKKWDELIDINLRSVFLVSKYILNHMLEKNISGDIINIGSIAGIVGYGESAAYCASKGGIVELTREMAVDYGPKGINVNAINPGIIKTDMTKDMIENADTRKSMEENTLTPRLGEPEDIANAVAYLSSPKSDFIMGENLTIDGGWTIH